MLLFVLSFSPAHFFLAALLPSNSILQLTFSKHVLLALLFGNVKGGLAQRWREGEKESGESRKIEKFATREEVPAKLRVPNTFVHL